uniref:CHAT domain-containing protein n=1 Tax=Oscillatoria sp. HE19RPO TaxID=2954806 RepID=UPI0020C34BB9
RAIACYQAALKVYTPEAFPQDNARTQNNLGAAYSDRIRGERGENLETAIACYEAALQVRTREAFPQDNAETLFNLGLAYRDTSQLQNAYDTFAQAINTVESIRSGIIEGGEADKQKLAEEYNQLYLVMVEVCLELENYAIALEYAERSKARNLVELLAATRLKPEGVSLEVWERYDRLYQEWWNIQQQRYSSASSTPATATADISHRLTQLRQDIDTLIETEIALHDRKFRFGQEVKRIRYAEIQALVDRNTAIVEWYFTSKGIHAFIVTCQGQQPIPVSTPSDAVEALGQLTDEYKNDYLHSDDTHWQQQLPAYLQRLAEILELDTLLSHIPPQCQQLVLVPYRYLHLFPLHALPVSETEYLSDKFPQGIRYAPSSQILQLSLSEDSTAEDTREGKIPPRPEIPKALFAIQNPTEDDRLEPYVSIEIEALQKLFTPVTVLKGKAASKTAFTQVATQLKESAFVHFSCHGSFEFENPRISKLFLADAKLPGIELSEKINPLGCLTLPEIFNLRFRQCRLLTLSACETGITDITTTSDEYISILAGFFFAGSRNVLGTLWEVDAFPTAICMIHFYKTLLDYKTCPSVALALKQTQEWMRQVTVAGLLEWLDECRSIGEERRKEMRDDLTDWYSQTEIPFQKPYFWAGFCAVGQ